MERQKIWNKNLEDPPVEGSSPGFLNIQQIAGYLGIKASTLYSMVEEKRIPHYRVGRLIRFKQSEIDEWMTGHKETAVDVKLEAKRVLSSVHMKTKPDVRNVIKRAIEEAQVKRYTLATGNQIKKRAGKGVSHESG